MAIIRGDKQISANLRAMAASPARVIDGACVEALEPMRSQTAENARALRQPHSPPGGHLDQGVVVAKIRNNGPYGRLFWVSFKRRARYLAHLVEFGTAPHWQPRRNRMHPGARAKPFFRPAFEQTKDMVAPIIGRRLWAGIVESIRGVTK